MIAVARCIVLHTVKYTDHGLILKTLTPEGLRSFFVRSYISKNRNKYPFLSYPLAVVECTYMQTSGNHLPVVKSLSLIHVPERQGYDFRRQAMVTFMAECGIRYIREETMSPDVFAFFEESILYIHSAPSVSAVYPVQFGFRLASMLGFDIGGKQSGEEETLFTLEKGLTTSNHQAELNSTDSAALIAIVSSPVNTPFEFPVQPGSLKNIFQAMLLFFRYHFPETAALKSPEILHLLME